MVKIGQIDAVMLQLQCLASFNAAGGLLGILIDRQGEADDPPSCLLEQDGVECTVHPAAHAEDGSGDLSLLAVIG